MAETCCYSYCVLYIHACHYSLNANRIHHLIRFSFVFVLYYLFPFPLPLTLSHLSDRFPLFLRTVTQKTVRAGNGSFEPYLTTDVGSLSPNGHTGINND